VTLLLESDASSPAEAERQVDAALDEFDGYFRTIQTDAYEGAALGLSPPERAIIKTFCAYFLGLGPRNPRAASKEGAAHAAPHRR
jgi:hypothetical protein